MIDIYRKWMLVGYTLLFVNSIRVLSLEKKRTSRGCCRGREGSNYIRWEESFVVE